MLGKGDFIFGLTEVDMHFRSIIIFVSSDLTEESTEESNRLLFKWKLTKKKWNIEGKLEDSHYAIS